MNEEERLKKRLVKHLQGGEAFTSLSHFINDVPYDQLGNRPANLPYSVYELFYHMQYAQEDIISFCRDQSYATRNWPDDYWPEQQHPKNEEDWNTLKTRFFEDRNTLATLIEDKDSALMDVVKNGEDQTLFREILLIIEHNAYHTGQLFILCRLLGVK
ncbi:DinB family protein [Flavimarina sp. Hel_I_48]|uniref:DinB family protein n=1 Tax=Flavimarina sp. Hel_I_48 TaxID=1392488 RepID=UPI0004DF95AC|nr:DinB family protein [Flavimarina sp. Hel_I_48]